MTRKTATLIGAALGAAAFLAIGLLPAMLYGGYAGVLLASGILGSPIGAGVLPRAFVVGGMVFGTTGVGALFTVAGAAAGAAVSVLVHQPSTLALK